MNKLNENYGRLKASYLFAEIAKRVRNYQSENPEKRVIRLGIGDVTEPLPKIVAEAYAKAAMEMADRDTFRGYPPEQGYEFIRHAIAEADFRSNGVNIADDEIFVSDGAKCDTGNFQELFGENLRIAVPDPVYPVYVDSNAMAGRSVEFINGTWENGFVPPPTDEKYDVVYLCYPNNPTGSVATREQLEAWVDYARSCGALILFDAAYEAFIREEGIPRSIFEIEGAREYAVEFRSFSKTAGFTGVRCAYTIVPKDSPLHAMWLRRQTTKFNGVSYPVQRAAEVACSPEGKKECKRLIDFYLENAALIRRTLTARGFQCCGGTNSPYVWVNVGGSSWDWFDKFLREASVVITPGAGFGKQGEGCIRISAFNTRENVEEAMLRMEKISAK